MIKKRILLVSDDPKAADTLQEMLGKNYVLELAEDRKGALERLGKDLPDLVLIDFDLKEENGLDIFEGIRPLKPDLKVIMLSSSASIPLAVNAAKLGVAEFLRKPLDAEQVKEAVAGNISKLKKQMRLPQNIGWLRGESPALKKMLENIQEALKKNTDLFLVGEAGSEKKTIAEVINENSPLGSRKLVAMDLASFGSEALETNFWLIFQDIMAPPDPSSLREERERSGTVFLDNFESIDEHFQQVLLKFLRERRGKIDKSIRVIIGTKGAKSQDLAFIEIPPLCNRKADLPYLLAFFLRHYSRKYNKMVKHISPELIEFLMAYDYPGSYLELERMIQGAVLKASVTELDLRDLPFNFRQFLQHRLKEDHLTLEKAKRGFEKKFYQVLLQKLDGNHSGAALFLDLPKAAFVERLEELEGDLLD